MKNNPILQTKILKKLYKKYVDVKFICKKYVMI